MTAANSWYRLRANAKAPAEVDLDIYDEIGGFGITAAAFKRDLDNFKGAKRINLRIHSPGGSVFDGLAIHGSLKRHPATVHVTIDGLAASIASVIAMAGDEIAIPENAFMMIHEPWTMTVGDAEELRQSADLLDKVRTSLLSVYAERTGIDRDEIAAMLEAETWMDGNEAVAKGFADRLADEPVKIAASFRGDLMAQFRSTPAELVATAAVDEIDNLLAEREQAAENARRWELDALAADARERGITEIPGFYDATGVDYSITVATARKFVMAKYGEGCTPSGPAPANIYAGNGAIIKDTVRNAVAARVGLAARETANDYRGASLLELARFSLKQSGVAVSNMAPMQIVGAAFTHSTGDFGAALENVAEKAMMRGWDEAPEHWSKWARRGTLPNFLPGRRIDLSAYPSLDRVPEGAEYHYATVSDRAETIVLATYGSIFSITRQAIINDDLSVFDRIAQAQGRAAARTVGDLATAVLTSNPDMSDGVALFHNTHGNLTSDSIDVTGLHNVRKAMRLQTGAGGEALNIEPGYLLCPAKLESQARQVLGSEAVPGAESNAGIANPVYGAAELLVDTRLDGADSGDAWYLIANGGDTVEVAFLDGQEAPFLEQQQGFTVDGAAFKVRIDCGVAPLDYRGMVKATGGLPI